MLELTKELCDEVLRRLLLAGGVYNIKADVRILLQRGHKCIHKEIVKRLPRVRPSAVQVK